MEQPLHPAQHDVVSALAYSLAVGAAEWDREEMPPPNDVAQFILRQQARMATLLRLPLGLLTQSFDWLGLMHAGRRFSRQPPAARARQIAAWKNSPLAVPRDFIRFYESLAELGWLSRAVQGEPRPAEVRGPGVVEEPAAEVRCEVAVLGSGPGGSITACLLAEAGRDVALLEEGPYLPLESCTPFTRAEMEQKYRHGGLAVALGAAKIAYVEGRCVGGGSEVNSGLYHRTPPEMLERWSRDFQIENYAEADMRPHFEACERDLSVSRTPGALPPASLKLHEGATRLGWESLEVSRWCKFDGGVSDFLGARQSMTRTYVPRFLRAGGRLLPNTRARRLRREGGRWVIEAGHGSGRTVRLSADTVFLAAGAVHTPALLQRSGLGRHAGRSLRLHPTIKLTAQFPETINTADMGVPMHQVKEFSPRLSFGGSISSPPYLALGLLNYPAVLQELPRVWPHMGNYYAMITGAGLGSVRALPGLADPLVRYRLTAADRRDLADGLRKLAEMMFSAGARAVFPGTNASLPLHGPDDLGKLPEVCPPDQTGLITIHLFSSCPMGEAAGRCTADSFGRVHGCERLFIADASLLPGAPGVNPQGSVMALARRNALRFLGKL